MFLDRLVLCLLSCLDKLSTFRNQKNIKTAKTNLVKSQHTTFYLSTEGSSSPRQVHFRPYLIRHLFLERVKVQQSSIHEIPHKMTTIFTRKEHTSPPFSSRKTTHSNCRSEVNLIGCFRLGHFRREDSWDLLLYEALLRISRGYIWDELYLLEIAFL